MAAPAARRCSALLGVRVVCQALGPGPQLGLQREAQAPRQGLGLQRQGLAPEIELELILIQ